MCSGRLNGRRAARYGSRNESIRLDEFAELAQREGVGPGIGQASFGRLGNVFALACVCAVATFA